MMDRYTEEPLLRRLHGAMIRHRRLIAIFIYAGVTIGSYLTAYLLRFEFRVPPVHRDAFLATLSLLLGVRLLASGVFRLYVGRWRYVSIGEIARLAGATALGSALFLFLLAVVPSMPAIPRSVVLIEGVLTLNGIALVWMTYRYGTESLKKGRRGDAPDPLRTLIVGAGDAGSRLAREMRESSTSPYVPIGYLDDAHTTQGTRILELPVLGRIEELPALAAAHRAEMIVIAVPSATAQELRHIADFAASSGVPFKVLPAIEEVLGGESGLMHLREVRVEDLLGREPVHLELPELAAGLEGSSVLITGAAGSIGSELARQVALHRPRRLLILDQAESPLYFLELELRQHHPELDIRPIIGDILDAARIDQLFEGERPEWVFHAAAYKHVPLMELNVREAILNNATGTWNVAEAAGRHEAGRFVLISTDKAVRPSSVMGETKRAAEQLILAAQARFPATRFTAVRFGNVLGSQGSVIPLFEKQLQTTRVLTVTDAAVTRYFMTIPEAVQLVLQASLLPEAGGRIAMLEMGEPVRIVDLARSLIRLAGLREGIDAHIEFIGLRPGEKIHEELVDAGEETQMTSVPRVRVISSEGTLERAQQVSEEILELAAELDELEAGEVRARLHRCIAEAILPVGMTAGAGAKDGPGGRNGAPFLDEEEAPGGPLSGSPVPETPAEGVARRSRSRTIRPHPLPPGLSGGASPVLGMHGGTP